MKRMALVVPCPACCGLSDDVASPSSTVVGDDVAPTSLNEGRGEVVVSALVFMFHLDGAGPEA